MLKSVTSGVGHNVHLAKMVSSPLLRGGKGWVSLCGNSQRIGGSWEPSETDAAPDCPECRAAASQLNLSDGQAVNQVTKAGKLKLDLQAGKIEEPKWFSVALEFDPEANEVKAACSINHSFQIDAKIRWEV